MRESPEKIRQKERERCLRLVSNYRKQIEDNVINSPKWNNYSPVVKPQVRDVLEVAQKIVASLLKIEKQIQSPEKVNDGPDFSMEEIARAEEIMREQNTNPFDEE